MRLHFAEAPERCSGSSVDAESDQDGQESLPVLMLPCTDSPVSGKHYLTFLCLGSTALEHVCYFLQ